ncbi:MAG TPA: HAMP domain-containing sensor histidine kinase [Clostridia bacterium]|nr:HAMP domain-containing sensor histidine kinase [Clostridia bacterium]
MKLRTKLTLVTVIIVVLAVFLSTFLVVAFTKQNTEGALIKAGIGDFAAFYTGFSDLGWYSGPALSDVSLKSYLRYRFLSISGNGEFILQQGDTVISNNTGLNAVRALSAQKTSEAVLADTIGPVQYAFFSAGRQDFLLMSSPIVLMQQEYTLSLARNITETTDNVDALGTKCMAAGSAITAVAALLVLLFVRRSLKPLRELEKGASDIAGGNYESRINLKGCDEVATVAEQFNSMASAISTQIAALHETAERRQAFINDLSHELKTPIASIMARAETLLRREITEEDRNRSLERIYHQCAWLERLSGKLTMLVMLQREIERKPESVADLFSSVGETVSESLNASGIKLHVDCQMKTLNMDVDLMRSALVNLVDNARKASKRGSGIELCAYENVFEVKDNGKGIPADEIARVAEPFYMVDPSRSKKSGGSGLGLALVKHIAGAHSAEMKIQSVPGSGTTVQIAFCPEDVYK